MNKSGWFYTGIDLTIFCVVFFVSLINKEINTLGIILLIFTSFAILYNIIFLKDKKEVIQMEKEKKQKKTREPNEWTKCVAKVRAENKGMKASEIFKKAKEVYKK